MADMVSNTVTQNFSKTIVAGKRVKLVILNSDGSEDEVLCDMSVPTGKTFNGSVSFWGTLS